MPSRWMLDSARGLQGTKAPRREGSRHGGASVARRGPAIACHSNTARFQLSAVLDETRLRRAFKDSSGQEQELAPAIVTSSAQVISPSNYREPHQRTAES